MSPRAALSPFKDTLHRLSHNLRWVFAQFGLTLIIILCAMAWTRLPDRHWWQVALSLLVPVILIISALELQAGTVRAFADDDGHRVKLVWGAVALLVWIAIGAALWELLDWCDDQIPLWAGYLNSQASAHARPTVFTYDHIARGLSAIEWIARWIIIPAKLIPFAAASAQWAWRLRWRSAFKLLWNLRWWIGVTLAALAGVWLPAQFFTATPKGAVAAQVWTVGFKLACAYILAVGSWVMLLAWYAALFKLHLPPGEGAMAPAPVLTGPPHRESRAKAGIPPRDDTPAG